MIFIFLTLSDAWADAQKDAKPDYVPSFWEVLKMCIDERRLKIRYTGTKIWGVSIDNRAHSVYRLTFILGILTKKEMIGTTRCPYLYGSTANLDDCIPLQMEHLDELMEKAEAGV
jgi:hypothetical protein